VFTPKSDERRFSLGSTKSHTKERAPAFLHPNTRRFLHKTSFEKVMPSALHDDRFNRRPAKRRHFALNHMPYKEGATPLANLCQKAGSSLDEVLALDEQELDELSKEIVGNGVLEHARVIRQWRRCRMEESLRKELEVELTNEGQGVEVPLSLTEEDRQEAQPKVRIAPNDLREQHANAVDAVVTPEKEQDVIGESWQQYLRKQIRVEMEETEPPPVRNVIAASRTTASGFTEEASDDDDYETYESITIDPSLASSSGEEDDDIRTTYNPLNPLGAVASDMMGYLEDGINSFFEPELPKKKTKEPPPKSFLEAGMDFLYANDAEDKYKRKKKKQPKTLLEDGIGYFCNDDDVTTEKQGNKRSSAKKIKKKTRARSFNRLKSKKERAHQTTEQEAYKLVPARRSLRSRFVV
jgi:hypothetical protein